MEYLGVEDGKISVISQMSSHKIAPKVFSRCLKGDGNGGGISILGEILDPRIVYTPLVPSQALLSMGICCPLIQQCLQHQSIWEQLIVDSGTTLVYLVEGAYEPFIAAINISVRSWILLTITNAVPISATETISSGNQCYLVSTSAAEIFPPVSFNFAGGASMFIKPTDYLVRSGFVDGSAMCYVGFLKAPKQGTTFLGDLVLKDKIFVYDLAHQRLGWAGYDCSLSVNVSLTPSQDEFMNAGQLSVSSSSSTTTVFRVKRERCIAAMLYILVAFASLFL